MGSRHFCPKTNLDWWKRLSSLEKRESVGSCGRILRFWLGLLSTSTAIDSTWRVSSLEGANLVHDDDVQHGAEARMADNLLRGPRRARSGVS